MMMPWHCSANAPLALRYDEVNPLAFEPAIAPHLAAREAGVLLDVAALQGSVQAILDRQADFTLVEGAGGLAGAAGWSGGPVGPGDCLAVAGDSGGRRASRLHQSGAAHR